MTEKDREVLIYATSNYWLPHSWSKASMRYTINGVSIAGSVESGSVNISVIRSDEKSAIISFTNEECYGEAALKSDSVMQRIYSGAYE